MIGERIGVWLLPPPPPPHHYPPFSVDSVLSLFTPTYVLHGLFASSRFDFPSRHFILPSVFVISADKKDILPHALSIFPPPDLIFPMCASLDVNFLCFFLLYRL